MHNYPNLFQPIQIGKRTVKNRIFMPPISTNLANKGYVTEELIQHYGARAKGGVGLIVSEVVTVEPTYVYLPGDMSIHDDSFIEGWTKLFEEVHKYGTILLPQLFHPAYMAFPIPGTPRLIAPSNVGPSYAKEAPRPVTVEEIHTITRQFGEAAMRVKQAGGDGVEIHAAHAHGLLGGFLSPLYNKRTDEYGGDINGRLKFPIEVIKEVRRVCGEDFIIDVRISGDEYSDGGLNINDATYIAKQFEKAGANMLRRYYHQAWKCDSGSRNQDGLSRRTCPLYQTAGKYSCGNRRTHYRSLDCRRNDCQWHDRCLHDGPCEPLRA